MIFPSLGMDSWISSRLFSIVGVWLWLGLLGSELGLRLVLIASWLGLGTGLGLELVLGFLLVLIGLELGFCYVCILYNN